MALPLTLTTGGARWLAARIAANETAEIDKLSIYPNAVAAGALESLTAATIDANAGMVAKEFTGLRGDTATDGEYIISTRDTSSDAYSHATVVAFSGATLVGAFSRSPALITKVAARDLVIEVGVEVSGTPLSAATFSVTGVNRATDSGHGTVRLMTPTEVASPLGVDAVPTGDDLLAILNALRPAVSGSGFFQRFTAHGTWTKPDGARMVLVEVIGGGGGGGTKINYRTVAYGGNAGKRNLKVFRASDLGATEPVIVGLGGGGATRALLTGVNGGWSRFGPDNNARCVRAPGGVNWDRTGTYDPASRYLSEYSRGGDMDAQGGEDDGGYSPSQNGGGQGTQGSVNGRAGASDPFGMGSGGGASYNGSVGSAGVNVVRGNGGVGGVPGGGGGAGGRYQGNGGGGAGARGEVRVWSW